MFRNNTFVYLRRQFGRQLEEGDSQYKAEANMYESWHRLPSRSVANAIIMISSG